MGAGDGVTEPVLLRLNTLAMVKVLEKLYDMCGY